MNKLSLYLWADPLYRQTVFLILGSLFAVAIPSFFLRHRGTTWYAHWASLQSWIIAAPILLVFMGLSNPWPLIVLTAVGILGAKTFFQMVGMYHRSNFVWMTYLGIVALAVCIHTDNLHLYNFIPMAFLGVICLVPIYRNSYKHMIQYIALSLMAFSFLGWSFMHLGWIWQLERGPFMVIYIVLLSEMCDNLYLLISRNFGSIKLFKNITPRRNLEAFLVAAALTMLLAWGMRHLLPDRSEPYWVASALVAALGGSIGDLTLSVLRRDLGIKDAGVFIIGRGDLLTIMDRTIFVAPIFYYAMYALERGMI
jgi:phosphatidate cytidylyltransferase